MNKKQKKVLIRIIVSVALMIALNFIPFDNKWVKLVCYLVPYFVIGGDILRKAAKGIINGQIFDENFLMSVATVG
ncbi:MAG: heavy metal translocating P-type ATPase, partial [Lachnospiraceae bacterium]